MMKSKQVTIKVIRSLILDIILNIKYILIVGFGAKNDVLQFVVLLTIGDGDSSSHNKRQLF